jgi:hypothetical protein
MLGMHARAQVQLMRQLLRDQPQAEPAPGAASSGSSAAAPGPSSSTAGGGGPISVSQLLHSFPATMLPGSAHTGVFTVTNSSGAQQTLMSVRLLQPVDGLELRDSGGGVTSARPAPQTLARGEAWTVTVTVTPRFIGYIKALVVFAFAGRSAVPRAVEATCDIAAEQGQPGVAPAERPYLRPERRRVAETAPGNVVPAPPPDGPGGSGRLLVPMGRHAVPRDMRKAAAADKLEALAQMLSRAGPAKSAAEYARRLQQLLWVEELQLEVDVQGYDMNGVEMHETSGRRLLLVVPGLAENRPCVMRGDTLRAWAAGGGGGGRMYEGRVVDVRREEVVLSFHSDFHAGHIRGKRYSVRFVINRSVFRLMHGALERAGKGMLAPLALCPGAPFAPLPLPLASPLSPDGVTAAAAQLPWANNRLNVPQQTAVVEVLRGAAGSMPYYIYGPPGTGKTMTLIEAAVQLLRQEQGAAGAGGTAGAGAGAGTGGKASLKAFMGAGAAPKVRVVPPPGGAAPATAPGKKLSSHPLGGKPSSSTPSSSVRVLLCAPSNSAADQLAQRLLGPGARGCRHAYAHLLCTRHHQCTATRTTLCPVQSTHSIDSNPMQSIQFNQAAAARAASCSASSRSLATRRTCRKTCAETVGRATR